MMDTEGKFTFSEAEVRRLARNIYRDWTLRYWLTWLSAVCLGVSIGHLLWR